MLLTSLLLALPASAPQAEAELLAESLPDGTYVEREVERGPGGEAVSHGGFKSWWAADKQIPKATGRYEHGRKRATWRTYYADKRRASKGKYEAGLRVGEWSYWLPDGELDAELSGDYSSASTEHASGVEYARGELRNGLRQGQWTLAWPNTAPLARGRYHHGARVGTWIFFHPDGTPDPRWITGEYAAGRRVRALEPEHPELADALEALTAPTRPLEALLGPALIGGDERDVLDALRNLLRLDLADAEQVEVGTRLVGQLSEAAGGPVFEWQPGATEEDQAINRLTVLRWCSFWTLLALDLPYGCFEYPRAAARLVPTAEVRSLEDLHPRLGSPAPLAADLGLLAGRFERPRRPSKSERRRSEAVDAALDWLVRHQNPDGSWSPVKFAVHCTDESNPEDEAVACTGPGQAAVGVGITALSLLALLGDGNTTLQGPHRLAVMRGLGWLLGQQDPTSGMFGQRIGHAYVYCHAIATLVMAEAAQLSGEPALIDSAQRGVELIHRARVPFGAWRYDIPPKEDSDTSVTGWVLQALDAARRAGLEVEDAALAGGLSWLDEATDLESGRCGYDNRGTVSARIERKNDHFPTDTGEALTGVALFSRILLGQQPGKLKVLDKHAELIIRRPPHWNPEGLGCDMYHWYYGTHALFQFGGPQWCAWQQALDSALLGSQRTDGHAAGSWDPAGPWGFSGGRVYSTALLALCLEAPHRLARVADQKQER